MPAVGENTLVELRKEKNPSWEKFKSGMGFIFSRASVRT